MLLQPHESSSETVRRRCRSVRQVGFNLTRVRLKLLFCFTDGLRDYRFNLTRVRLKLVLDEAGVSLGRRFNLTRVRLKLKGIPSVVTLRCASTSREFV